MHLFYIDKDNPGELAFCWPWLPHWMVFHGETMNMIYDHAKSALPQGIKVSELTEDHWKALDEAAISAMEKALPYIKGIRQLMQSFVNSVEFDEAKAPPAKFAKRPVLPMPPQPPHG